MGYWVGAYSKIKNDGAGFITGKGLQWGGSHIRPEATGYGLVYFAEEMLKTKGDSLEGKRCLISGSGNVAQYTAEKLLECGAKVLTMSDSGGYMYDCDGIGREKLKWIMELKNVRRGRIKEYADEFSNDAAYYSLCVEVNPFGDTPLYSPLWKIKVDCAFPCATENEIGPRDAENLIENGVKLVAEGANMPCTPKAIKAFQKAGILFGPGKAANAGGVVVSGLEMSQNSVRYGWPREEVDKTLHQIMRHIHEECLSAAEAYGQPGNYEAGANIAGFIKVGTAMFEQGIV